MLEDARPPGVMRLVRLAAVLVAGLAIWLGLGGLPHNVDDAYISIRYADNLARGEGLVYNPGERVEGFSNPVWTLALVLPAAMGLDALMAAKILGLACTGLAAGTAVLLAAELARPRTPGAALATALGAAMLAISHPATWWATGGLETPSVGAALLLSLYLMTLEARDPGRRPWSALVAGLAATSRPETPLLVGALALGRAVLAWPGRDLRGLLRWCALAAILPLGWLAFRLGYYPDPLPNTFYRKSIQAPLTRALAYVLPWVKLEAPFLLAGTLGLLALLRARAAQGLALLGLVLGQLVFLLWSRGDWMPSHRFLVPMLPALAVGVGASAGLLAARSRLAIVLVAALLCVQAERSVPVREVGSSRSLEAGARVSMRAKEHWAPWTLGAPFGGAMQAMTVWLLERVPPDATLAYTEIGLPGYAGGWRILDLDGLVTRETSGAARMDQRAMVRWVRAQNPDWIVLKGSKTLVLDGLRAAPWLGRRYVPVVGAQGTISAWRRKGRAEATPEEALQNFERAVSRAPRMRLLLLRWVRMARLIGTLEDFDRACAHVARYTPTDEALLKTCARRHWSRARQASARGADYLEGGGQAAAPDDPAGLRGQDLAER